MRSWIAALDPAFALRLPRLEVVPAEAIVRVGGSILFNARPARTGGTRRRLRLAGDRSTQAVSYVPQHVVVLHRRLFRQRWLGQRLFYHELCHFLWPRLGRGARRGYVAHLRREVARGVRGELGDSAQHRKQRLLRPARRGGARRGRPRRGSAPRASGQAWRDYACESFCDTGAYRLAQSAGLGRPLRSVEFTLAPRYRPARLAAWQRAVKRNSKRENRK